MNRDIKSQIDTSKNFRALLIGPSCSGKSTLVKQCLKELKGVFEEIFIISPTVNDDNLYKNIKLKNDKENKSEDATNKQFDKYMDKIKENGDKGKRSLLIVDDSIGSELMKINGALARNIIKIRHHNASLIVCSQNYKSIVPIIRNNMTHLSVFINPSLKEIQKMTEEIGDRFRDRYEETVKEPYQYLAVDYTKHELDPERYTNKLNLK